MQAHRRKKKKRPVLSYMRNVRSVFLEADDDGKFGKKFGFTLSGEICIHILLIQHKHFVLTFVCEIFFLGQQPCILSSIVKKSPADNAGVKSGDFLIFLNGKSVWQKSHEEIVELIGTSGHRIHITIADNYLSDSSEEEEVAQFRFRPKYPYSKSRSNRSSADSPHRMPPHRFHTHPPLPNIHAHHRNNNNNNNSNVSGSINNNNYDLSSANKSEMGEATTSSSAMIINHNTNVVTFVVGYLGTIEMPKQIATSSKLQTVRSCIRKMRQEKRSPTLVLMNILPNSLNLFNSNNALLASYSSNRLTYISSSSDNNSKFFGLVTSATFQEESSLALRQVEIAISNSCHVFGIETKLIDHNAHIATAEKFQIKCTKDLISNSCLEFPTTSDYICNIIKSMYNIKSQEKADLNDQLKRGSNNQHHHNNNNHNHNYNHVPRRSNRFNDPHELLLPNSPHPSNHSEVTTSSNSDSGIGFHNDLTNISDRILVVDFPEQNRSMFNENVHMLRQRKSRPLGIVNDFQLQENALRNMRSLNVLSPHASQAQSSHMSSDMIFHAKSKSADFGYINNNNTVSCSSNNNLEKLAIRAMPLKNFETENLQPKAITDVWYDGEMLDEDGNEIHERAIDDDIPKIDKEIYSDDQKFQKLMMIRSCDDIMMIMDREDLRYRKNDNDDDDDEESNNNNNTNNNNNNNANSTDDHIFLMPTSRPAQKKSKKRSSTLLSSKSKTPLDDARLKYENNMKHYKLSPKVFGLTVSMSFENLSSTTSTSKKRRSLFGINKKKEAKNHEDEEELSIWASLQELRNSDLLKKDRDQVDVLESAYSEPNLNFDEVSA
jgi:regulator of G-protein signaling